MKVLHYLILFLTCTVPLWADNVLQNGDFTDGALHWRGDGKTPADMASSDPFAKPDPLLAQGLIIPLKHLDWAKVQQDFRTSEMGGVLSITYKVSPDLAFTDKAEEYTNIPSRIDYTAYKPFNVPVGSWMVMITDFGMNKGQAYYLQPKLGSSDPQTINLKVKDLTTEDKILLLTFPPGTGNVVLLKVSLSKAGQ